MNLQPTIQTHNADLLTARYDAICAISIGIFRLQQSIGLNQN